MTGEMRAVLTWQIKKIGDLLDTAEPLPIDTLHAQALEFQVLLAEASRERRLADRDEEAVEVA